MTTPSLQDRNYNLSAIKTDPLTYLAKMVGIKGQVAFMKKHKEKVLPILSGLVVYRQLSPINKRKLLESAQHLGDKHFFSQVQSIAALMIANPYWNTWCLSDQEVREYFDTNKAVSDFLGTWFFTVDGKFEVAFVATTLYEISNSGFTGFLKNATGSPMVQQGLQKLPVSKASVQFGTRCFFVAVLLASVVKKFSDIDAQLAKEELLRRGLLQAKDL